MFPSQNGLGDPRKTPGSLIASLTVGKSSCTASENISIGSQSSWMPGDPFTVLIQLSRWGFLGWSCCSYIKASSLRLSVWFLFPWERNRFGWFHVYIYSFIKFITRLMSCDISKKKCPTQINGGDALFPGPLTARARRILVFYHLGIIFGFG